LATDLETKSTLNLVKLCQHFTRGELLPTQQDILGATTSRGSDETLPDENETQQRLQEALNNTKSRLQSIESDALSLMTEAVDRSEWGLSIVSVRLDGFSLLDPQISADLARVTQSLLATSAEQVQGRLEVARAEAERITALKRANAEAQVAQRQAESAAQVRTSTATAEAQIHHLEAVQKAKADAEVQRINLALSKEEAENRAEIRRLELSLQTEEAEAKALGITKVAQATAEKMNKEYEAAKQMPQQEFELKRVKLAVEGLQHYGQSAWRYPDSMTAYIEQLMPYLRLGPASAKEIFASIASKTSNHNPGAK
jgi:hypothetical protein